MIEVQNHEPENLPHLGKKKSEMRHAVEGLDVGQWLKYGANFGDKAGLDLAVGRARQMVKAAKDATGSRYTVRIDNDDAVWIGRTV